jgi:hypothetical protein
MCEIWKMVKYAPNYEISNLGNIKNKKTNRLLTINYERLKKDNKRARPGLSHNGKIKGYYLHRIVAEHFLDNPDNLPEVNHIDGDYYNNKLSNLEWISKLDNMRHASENKLMKRYTRKVIIKNLETGCIKRFESVTKCAEYLNYSIGKVTLTCRDKRKDKIYDIEYLDKEERNIDETDIIWKAYPECDKYLVSNTGEVKNAKTGRIMMGSKQNGYRFLCLYLGKDIPKMNRLVHRMIAQTFLDNPEDKPVVNHKDTNILNNHVDNLEWVTYKENMNTAETIKNLKKGKNSKIIHQIYIETGEIVNTFDSFSECEKHNIKCSWNICNYYHSNYNKKYSQKTYKKKYIFIFDIDKDKLKEFLIEAKISNKGVNNKLSKKVVQIDKNSGETIKTYNSGYEASKILNISQSGINQCCQYYRYDDENRPKCYKYSKQYKGYIFKQV